MLPEETHANSGRRRASLHFGEIIPFAVPRGRRARDSKRNRPPFGLYTRFVPLLRLRTVKPWRVVFAAGVLLLPRAVTGQVSTVQEISERSLLPRAEIDQAMAESRFRLGPVYLSPAIAIREATYDSNIFGTTENPTGDFRTTVLAGAGLILPVGKNVFLRASAVSGVHMVRTARGAAVLRREIRRINSPLRQPADAGCLRRLLEDGRALLVGGADARD